MQQHQDLADSSEGGGRGGMLLSSPRRTTGGDSTALQFLTRQQQQSRQQRDDCGMLVAMRRTDGSETEQQVWDENMGINLCVNFLAAAAAPGATD